MGRYRMETSIYALLFSRRSDCDKHSVSGCYNIFFMFTLQKYFMLKYSIFLDILKTHFNFFFNSQVFKRNNAIHRDLNTRLIREDIKIYSTKYQQRLSNHQNSLTISLVDDTFEVRRL